MPKYHSQNRDRIERPIEDMVLEFVRNVLAGSKSNNAMHSLLKGSRLTHDRRSILVRTCHGTLRYWYLIRDEINSDDPAQMAAAGVLLFTDWVPNALGIERRRLAVLKEKLKGPGNLKNCIGAKEARFIPESSAMGSVPTWLKDRLVGSYRAEARWILADSLVPPKHLGIRTNTILTNREELAKELNIEGIPSAASEIDPDALLIPDGSPIDKLEPYRNGHMEVQDLSSQISCRLAVAGREQGKVIDACAGNGGKSLALAALMGNKGVLISMDTNERSLLRLRQRARRAQLWNYQRVHVKGDKDLDPFREWADVVLVDAPCSGLGTMRRNPDIRLHLTPEDMERFPGIQYDILDTYSALVKKGGRLVYTTCSLDPAENEKVVERFLKEKQGFLQVRADGILPDLPKGMFRGPYFYPLPGDDRSGFFAAVMERADQ